MVDVAVPLKHFKVSDLPAQPVANAIYFVDRGASADEYVTSNTGVAKPVGTAVDLASYVTNAALATALAPYALAAWLSVYAPLASPPFTGNPTAPNQTAGSNNTRIANTAYVDAAIAALINSAPGALDTLGEIATALANDESTAAALATTVAGKLTKSSNLSDLTNAATARTNLGLAAVASSGLYSDLTGGPDLSGYAAKASANIFTSAVQTVQGASGTSPGWYAQITGDTASRIRVGVNANDVASIGFGPGSAARDLFLERAGAANLRQGGADSATPIAQTQSVQNVLAGTSNTAGANFTIAGSQGTGTGLGGSLLFQVAPAGSTGTAVNALATALTIDSTKAATFAGQLTIAQGSIATSQPFALTQTWATSAGAYTAALINVADSGPSTTGSLLLDLQVASASVMSVRKDGRLFVSGRSFCPTMDFGIDQSGMVTIMRVDNAVPNVAFGYDGTNRGMVVHASGSVRWGSSAVSSADLYLVRDAAGTSAQRNGANAQAFRIYNTYTDASNYERSVFDFTTTASVLTIGTQKLGTGTTRPLQFVIGGTVQLDYGVSGGGVWTFAAPIFAGGTGIALGGKTSAFPALLRVGAELQVRLADASGPAPLRYGYITKAGAFTTADVAAGECLFGYDSTNNTRKVYMNQGGVLYAATLT